MKRRHRVRATRRKLATTTSGAIADIESDFRKATRFLALLMALLFMAKQTGGLDFPIYVNLEVDGDHHPMSTSDEKPGIAAGDVLQAPTTVRLTQKLETAIAEEAAKLRVKESEAHRRILERGLCDTPPAAPPIHGLDLQARAAIDALRAQSEALQANNRLLCDSIQDLRTELGRYIENQNRALLVMAQVLFDVLAMTDPEGKPTDQALAYVEKHLRVREREE